MTHLVPISAPVISTLFVALKRKESLILCLGNVSISADLVLLKRRAFYLITTLLTRNQHSLAKRGSDASGAKPKQSWLQVCQGPWLSAAHWSWNPAPLLWGEGAVLPFQHWVGDQEPMNQEELVSGSQHFEEPCTPPAMLMATWQLFQQL